MLKSGKKSNSKHRALDITVRISHKGDFLDNSYWRRTRFLPVQAGSLVMISAWADKRNGYRKTDPGFRPERSGARSAMPEISEESADTLVHPVFPLQTPFDALHGHGCLQAPGLPRRKGADLSPTSATAR